MRYEIHITISNTSVLDYHKFNQYCRSIHGCKANLIELSKGEYPLQLMLTKRDTFETDNQALKWGNEMSSKAMKDGWDVTRLKVESPLTEGKSEYFEVHFNFHVYRKNRPDFHSFLEKNPQFLHSHNLVYRPLHYLSLREYYTPVGHGDYIPLYNKFLNAETLIKDFNLPLVETQFERVLIDTNPDIDKGWV